MERRDLRPLVIVGLLGCQAGEEPPPPDVVEPGEITTSPIVVEDPPLADEGSALLASAQDRMGIGILGSTQIGVGTRHDPEWILHLGGPGGDQPFGLHASENGLFLGGESSTAWFSDFGDPCVAIGPALEEDCGDAIVLNVFTGEGVQFGDLETDEVRSVHAENGFVTVAGRTRSTRNSVNNAYAKQFTMDLQTEVWTTVLGTEKVEEFLAMTVRDGAAIAVGGSTAAYPVKFGREDMVAVHFAPNGEIQGTSQVGSGAFDTFEDVVTDEEGVYVVGQTAGYVGLEEGGQSAGLDDAALFVWSAPFDELVCVAQFGTPGRDVAKAIGIYGDALFVVGRTEGVLNGELDDGATCHNGGDDVLADAFVSRYDKNCNHLWTRTFGTTRGDAVESVTVDADHVYLAGHINAGKDHSVDERAPSSDGFLRIYDHDGELEGEVVFDSAVGDDLRCDFTNSIALWDGLVYVGGGTEGVLGLDGSLGGPDIFVATIPIEDVVSNATYVGTGCN